MNYLSSISSVLILVMVIMQQQSASANQTTDEARAKLLSLVKKDWPNYCSMAHVYELFDYEEEYLFSHDELRGIYSVYLELLYKVCGELLDEKMSADSKTNRVFPSLFNYMSKFREMVQNTTPDSDQELFGKLFNKYLYKMAEEGNEKEEEEANNNNGKSIANFNIHRPPMEQQIKIVFAELKHNANRLKSIIDYDLLPTLTLATRVNKGHPSATEQAHQSQEILDMRFLCYQVTLMRAPVEEYASDPRKSVLPEITNIAQVNGRFGVQFEALANLLVE